MDISSTSAQYIKGVGPDRLKMLKRLRIKTVKDCLWHFPHRYEDRSKLKAISQLEVDKHQTIKGDVLGSKIFRTKRAMTIFQLTVGDGTGKIYCLWFRQPYMKKYFKAGDVVILYGKVQKPGTLQMIHPEYEIIKKDESDEEVIHTGRIVPIYPLVSGINQRRLRSIIKHAVQQYSFCLTDILPTSIRARHRLFDLRSAVKNIHFPASAGQMDEARRRLVFDEFFILQLALALRRRRMRYAPEGKAHNTGGDLQKEFFKALPFELTASQKKVIEDIKKDMSSPLPMHRLVQGDVGSGKTVVCAYALLLTAANRHQGAMMVPTEILARQHYITLSGFFSSIGIRTVLLISGMSRQQKDEALKSIESGEADIIVGTHTLIQNNIVFKDLGLIVIDEQHKFGVRQRASLKYKTANPDIMVMTATPIPRTIAMTLYGDMDMSVINELPQGERDVRTIWLEKAQLEYAYNFIKEQLLQGRQAYIVYPAIGQSAALRSEGAERMYDRLKEDIFKEFKVGLIHGRMEDAKKTDIMRRFKAHDLDIMVATTVIEVGIDVRNASVMLIDGAERFGLSQLHQLRGRIGRGGFVSYCLLVSDAKTDEARQRLEIISGTEDGFEISQEDLNIRGPGELFSKRQHGLPELRLGDISADIGILEAARKEAFALIEEDPCMKEERHRGLKARLTETFKGRFHLGLIG